MQTGADSNSCSLREAETEPEFGRGRPGMAPVLIGGATGRCASGSWERTEGRPGPTGSQAGRCLLMAKNLGPLEEKGSEMAPEGVFACVARIVWQLHPRQSPHSGRPRTGADPGTGSCTHAAHLTVAAHGPGLFEGSRDRQLHPRRSPHSGRPRTGAVRGLPGQAPQACFENAPRKSEKPRPGTDLGRTATPEAWTPILRLSFSLDRIVWTPAAPHSLNRRGACGAPN